MSQKCQYFGLSTTSLRQPNSQKWKKSLVNVCVLIFGSENKAIIALFHCFFQILKYVSCYYFSLNKYVPADCITEASYYMK